MQAEPGAGSSGDPALAQVTGEQLARPQHETREGAPAPVTGVPAVDKAIANLDELADLPVGEHPAVFERVHRELAEALGDLGHSEDATTHRPLPPRPGR